MKKILPLLLLAIVLVGGGFYVVNFQKGGVKTIQVGEGVFLDTATGFSLKYPSTWKVLNSSIGEYTIAGIPKRGASFSISKNNDTLFGNVQISVTQNGIDSRDKARFTSPQVHIEKYNSLTWYVGKDGDFVPTELRGMGDDNTYSALAILKGDVDSNDVAYVIISVWGTPPSLGAEEEITKIIQTATLRP